MTDRIVGIDPGLDGGIGVVTFCDGPMPGSDRVMAPPLLQVARVELYWTPTVVVTRGKRKRREYNLAGMRELLTLRACAGAGVIPHIVLERQGARPQQGVVSTFRTGLGFGLWWGIVVGLGLPHSFIAPQDWKRWHRLSGTNKAASRLRLQELVPEVGHIPAWQEGCAEAALMALYIGRFRFGPEVAGVAEAEGTQG